MSDAKTLLNTLKKKTYIELFAGCGGLSLGLHYGGWHGLFAVERDPMAFSTLQKNLVDASAPYRHFTKWPRWIPKKALSIEDVLDNKVIRAELAGLKGKVSLVAGGPPCQGFSVGGSRNGADVRNSLPFKMLDFVSIVEPPIVLIENVEGIAREFMSRPTFHEGSAVLAVTKRLEELGYSAGYQLVRATDFCVPQDRRRILILAIAKPLARLLPRTNLFESNIAETFGEHLKIASEQQKKELGFEKQKFITIEEALGDLAGQKLVECPDSPKFQSAKYEEAKSRYAKMMRRGIKSGEVPNSHRFSIHGDKVLSLYRAAHAAGKRGRLSKEFLLSHKTKTDKKVLLDPKGLSSTLTTHPDEQIHFLYPRNITLREMARIQSFPDDFHFFGRYTLNGPRRKLDVARCAQIGNAVPPFLGWGVARALDNLIYSLEQIE
jgi:DNA (cytosine-5)-methyltransferase 1